MRQYTIILIASIIVLVNCLFVTVCVAMFLYDSLVNYPTPEVSYANAKDAAVKECKKYSSGISEQCTNLQLKSMSKIDVGNDASGTNYVFKNKDPSNGTTYSIWVAYSGRVDRADVLDNSTEVPSE